jgi:hypothetical protein
VGDSIFIYRFRWVGLGIEKNKNGSGAAIAGLWIRVAFDVKFVGGTAFSAAAAGIAYAAFASA